MKKVSNDKYAKYLFGLYAAKKKNIVFKDGDVYLVKTGDKQAEIRKVATLYQCI